MLARIGQAAEGIRGVVEKGQGARGVGPVVVADITEAEHAHAARRPFVQLAEVVTQRVSVEHADKHRELAFAMQTTQIIRGIGDADLIGKVAHHARDDLIARFLLVARRLDKPCGGAVRCVGSVPDFRPAENRQCCTGQPSLGGLGQVELARAVLVGFIARCAELQRHRDVAVKRQHAVL